MLNKLTKLVVALDVESLQFPTSLPLASQFQLAPGCDIFCVLSSTDLTPKPQNKSRHRFAPKTSFKRKPPHGKVRSIHYPRRRNPLRWAESRWMPVIVHHTSVTTRDLGRLRSSSDLATPFKAQRRRGGVLRGWSSPRRHSLPGPGPADPAAQPGDPHWGIDTCPSIGSIQGDTDSITSSFFSRVYECLRF